MRLLSGIGTILLTVLKWMLNIAVGMLRLALEGVKIFLLLFSLVLRVFLAFVGAGLP